ncbi:MAG: hypothetical protein M1828_002230 [Chrysothrix sp. TS-e1954]|nr:MAG: hypothetical protein M1828_002230 [Chrysothrix sp. TS-e1954]
MAPSNGVMPASKTALKIVFGAMTFGREGTEQARVFTPAACASILKIFTSHDHTEVDTSRFYGEGTSEQFLGELDWQSLGLTMQTKFFPTHGKPLAAPDQPEGGFRHIREHMRQNLDTSLRLLKTDSIDLWYLHSPDRSTPYEETLEAVNELYNEGKFKRFGLSNYQAWEVAQICEICARRGFKKPDVYQGVYNALHRSIEPELLPCLRHYDIAFYNYNPLAGGYLTSRYHRETKDAEVEPGSRYDPSRWQGKMYRMRYWNEPYFAALDLLRPVAKKHGLTEAECALRWMMHHSALSRERGDATIIGASSEQHLKENLVDFEKEKLPEEVLKALDQGWEGVKGISGRYWH